MKTVTYKQIGRSFLQHRKVLDLVTPTICGKGEFITVGARNNVVVVFIKSERLDNEVPFNQLFGLSHDTEKHMSIIQYNANLGGYLYSWANY